MWILQFTFTRNVFCAKQLSGPRSQKTVFDARRRRLAKQLFPQEEVFHNWQSPTSVPVAGEYTLEQSDLDCNIHGRLDSALLKQVLLQVSLSTKAVFCVARLAGYTESSGLRT